MAEFPKPKFQFDYSVKEEVKRLRAHREKRRLPTHPETRLAVASWNIANLGAHDRRESDYRLMAEMISWFDLVALQEVRENLDGLRAIQEHLPKKWAVIFTDRSGNDERLTFLYRTDRVRPRELIGEVSLLPNERRKVALPDTALKFEDFNRSPMLCSFEVGTFHFTLANVHIYFGADSGEKFHRRRLEVLAIAVYAKSRNADRTRYDEDLMLIGDFNTPQAEQSDKVYRSLIEAGLVPPDTLHGTVIGGNTIRRHTAYDQLMMFPNTKQKTTATKGVFDFDTVVFHELWDDQDKKKQEQFFEYVQYYLSDHRILWTAFRV